MKTLISRESKTNFVLERDVRYLDSRIGLLIAERMAVDKQTEFAHRLEDPEEPKHAVFEDQQLQRYASLFFVLQMEPRHIAMLCRLVSLAEIDSLLQTVMFTLYGNQYEPREEHLLLTMFQSVLMTQFECATDFGSLLRANTPVSRMMSTYTRRGPGQSYLKRVLAPRINEVLADRMLDPEVNPQKIYEELRRLQRIRSAAVPESAADVPEVQRVLQARVDTLTDTARGFLDTIIDSTSLVPYGIRWICKQIHSLASRKFPGASDAALCSLTGAFFFLRFVNPAIIMPEACMLVDRAPAPASRRALTLVAKLLQTLVNRPSVLKEPYMEALLPFVDVNTDRMRAFLHELCNVGDFYDTAELDQYAALSKRELKLNITVNEIFHMHKLVSQHIDVLASQDAEHLRELIVEIGPPQRAVPRRENYALELSLFSRYETQVGDLTTTLMNEHNMNHNDILYMETKNTLVQLFRSLPHAAGAQSHNLYQMLTTAEQSRNPSVVQKSVWAQEMVSDLEQLHMIDAQYCPLSEEVAAQLEALGTLRIEVLEELENLRSVLSNITEHNAYLQTQLEAYKSYLRNVRLASSTMKEQSTTPSSTALPAETPHADDTLAPLQEIYCITHTQLQHDGVLIGSSIPAERFEDVHFQFECPSRGAFLITLFIKDRAAPVLEIDMKLDDLLEEQRSGTKVLTFEYVRFNIALLQALLDRMYALPNRIRNVADTKAT